MKKLYIIVAFLLVSSSIFAQLNESFEGTSFPPAGWKMVDQDGDGNNWFQYTVTTGNIAHTGTYAAASASWYNQVILTPTNYLITPSLVVSSATDSIAYWTAPQDKQYPGEHYEVKVSTTGNNPADFTTTLYSYTFTFADTLVDWHRKAHSLAAYANDTIYVAFVHTNCTDMFYLKLDDVTGPAVYIPSNDMEVSSVQVPSGAVYAGNISIKAILKNNGSQTQTAGKVVSFYNGATLLGTANTTADIAPNTIDSVTYTWTNAPAGSFVIKAQVVADQDNSNNFATANLSVYAAGTVIESFEGIAALPPTGWTNPETWALGTNPVNAFEGTQYAYVPASTASAKLITPKLDVVAGDKISFKAYTLATSMYPTIQIQYSTSVTGPWTNVAAANFTLGGTYTEYTANLTVAGMYYYSFTCANSSTSSARMDFVVMPKLAPVGINEVTTENSNFSIYPNPVKNELNITSASNLKNIKIINAVGQEIENKNVSGNHYKINTSTYNKGIYFVQIESEKGKTTKKFVVSE